MWNKLGGLLRRKNPAAKAGGAHNTQPDARIDAWMREAYPCHRNGEISKAEELYRRILQEDPEYADALYFLGEIERGRGRPEEAIGLLQRAVRADGANPRFHFGLGCALQSCGRLKEAASSYRRALDLDGGDAEVWNNLGVVEQQSGRVIEAERCYRRALELEGGYAPAHFNLGNLFRGAGRLEDAAVSLRRAVELEPGHAEAWMGLGAALYQLERQEEAAVCYRRVIELFPGQHEAHYNLGCALAALGRKDEAIESYRHALGIKPDYAEAEMNLGLVLQEGGEPEQAIAHYRRALELKPDYAEACLNLGQALAETGQAEAAACFERALEVNPRFAKAYNNLGVLQDRQGHLAQAMETMRRAIAVAPDCAESYCNLGYLCMKDGKLDEAEACFSRAVQLAPELTQAHNNLGFMLQKRKAFDEAEQAYLRAIERNPGMGEALHNLGNLYLEQCRLPEAEHILRKAFEVDPRHANLLFLFNYIPGRDAVEDFAEYRRWHARLVAPMAPAATRHANDADPRRRLRIGYVSPDFCRHSVAHFFEPLLAARDRGRYEIFCYSNTPASKWDEVTERLRAAADGWREIRELEDDAASELIRGDRIDILVDLAGHTDGHRLLLFARKPAPVQVTYLGYPNTTGLDAMDYRITDSWADPPEGAGDSCYTEELVRLPRGFLCYRPDPDAPEPAPLPSLAAGRVTFASFNNLAKLNRELITLWSRILRAVPGSRLLLKAASLQDRGTRERITIWFAEQGVDAARLELHAQEKGVREHLKWYHRADIGLDTFPYNGTTTTCEALWMGVPVITLAGERHAGRVGVSLLKSLGIDSLIAETAEDYVARAVALAADLPRLKALREELRRRMDASPLCDAPSLTREIEAAYRSMWERWRQRRA